MKIPKEFSNSEEESYFCIATWLRNKLRSKFPMKGIFFWFCCSFCVLAAAAQQTEIQLGPDEIPLNYAWTISVTVHNGQLRSYDNFPDIDGFQKRGTSSSSQTSIINGQVSSAQSVIMTYVPTRQGSATVPSFKMKVNDQVISVTGKRIKVGPPAQAQPDPFRSMFDRDAFGDFFGRDKPTEFVDVKADAFLALTTSSDEVYVGEGFTATLAFYISENNQPVMRFHDLGTQLAAIVKKLKPANCWEENFSIETIDGESVVLNGKRYTKYKIYQSTFFPFNNQPVTFPSVGLQIVKYKMAKTRSFFGQERQEVLETFDSKSKTVKVKDLPPHPLRDAVAVGNYHLDERIGKTELKTGQSVSYDFSIYGEGNISSIQKPAINTTPAFDIYEPNVRQDINREAGHVGGTKTFSYFIIPKEPGQFNLGDQFQWIYFNLQKKKYDTLRSKLTVNVSGESQKNQAIGSNDLGSFYDRLDSSDNRLQARSSSGNVVRWSISILAVVLLGAAGYFMIRKL